MAIHPSAIVDSKAAISDTATIGPYVIIEGDVQVGDYCRVEAHSQLYGRLEMGSHNAIGPAAIIGTPPQDLGFDRNTASGVRLGSHNTLREHVTIHRSAFAEGWTEIGSYNFLMVGSHLGHDVRIGDQNVIANDCLLAGHVVLGNGAFLGGGGGFHQFLRLGDHCMVHGGVRASQDIAPYVIATEQNWTSGVNWVGLRRAGFSPEERAEIKQLFSLFYYKRLPLAGALRCAREKAWSSRAEIFIQFFEAESKKGICRRLRLKSI